VQLKAPPHYADVRSAFSYVCGDGWTRCMANLKVCSWGCFVSALGRHPTSPCLRCVNVGCWRDQSFATWPANFRCQSCQVI